MGNKRIVLGCFAVSLLAFSASADTMKDPAAGVESDNFSSPISKFVGQFDPTANNGIMGFFNDTGAIITSLSLHTTIATNLTTADISSSFSCNSGAADPFFLNCGFDYVSSTGSLTINFFGVNPSDGDELTGRDAEIGEHEGIPPVTPACLPNPNAPGCQTVGHFAFVFNDNFQQTGNLVDEWVPTTTSTANPNKLLFNGPPLFDAPGFTTAPEPSSLILLGSAIFALARLSRRRIR
jgi:hypothetical protein